MLALAHSAREGESGQQKEQQTEEYVTTVGLFTQKMMGIFFIHAANRQKP